MMSDDRTRGRARKVSAIRREVAPKRRARIDAAKDVMIEAERLTAVRSSRGVTQVQLAERIGKS